MKDLTNKDILFIVIYNQWILCMGALFFHLFGVRGVLIALIIVIASIIVNVYVILTITIENAENKTKTQGEKLNTCTK